MIEKKTKIKQIVRVSHVMPFQPVWHPPSHCPVILSHLALTPQLRLHCLWQLFPYLPLGQAFRLKIYYKYINVSSLFFPIFQWDINFVIIIFLEDKPTDLCHIWPQMFLYHIHSHNFRSRDDMVLHFCSFHKIFDTLNHRF